MHTMQSSPFHAISTIFVPRQHLQNKGVAGVVKSAIINVAFNWLEAHGYDMDQPQPFQRESRRAFFAAEQAARLRYERLDHQTKLQLPLNLSAKYESSPVLGTMRVYDAIALLASIIDPLDPYLGCVSQLTHQLQLVQLMEQQQMSERLILCALVHDLGKLLIKYGDEDPMNVEAAGKKVPLHGRYGDGLRHCTFRWDHGDFAYSRIKDHVPDDVSWLVRHHSIDIDACEPYMDDLDREYVRDLLRPFAALDDHKDMYAIPTKCLEDYRALIERYFPDEILI